jgi:hypothetical protein
MNMEEHGVYGGNYEVLRVDACEIYEVDVYFDFVS